jgi:hypothetical protein
MCFTGAADWEQMLAECKYQQIVESDIGSSLLTHGYEGMTGTFPCSE